MKQLSSLFALIMMCSILQAQSTILLEDFEDNTLTFTPSSPLFADGGSDYFTIVPLNGAANPENPYTGFVGNYFAAEDIDDGGTRPSTGTLSFTVDISDYENISFSTLFAAGGNDDTPSYDSNDGFLITAQIDGGAVQNLLSFEAIGTTNQQLRQDTDFDGTGDGFIPTSAFTAFNDIAIVGTGTTLTLEVIVSSNDGNVEYAFDNIQVSGDLVTPPVDPIPTMGQWSLFILAMMMSSLALGFMVSSRKSFVG